MKMFTKTRTFIHINSKSLYLALHSLELKANHFSPFFTSIHWQHSDRKILRRRRKANRRLSAQENKALSIEPVNKVDSFKLQNHEKIHKIFKYYAHQ